MNEYDLLAIIDTLLPLRGKTVERCELVGFGYYTVVVFRVAGDDAEPLPEPRYKQTIPSRREAELLAAAVKRILGQDFPVQWRDGR